jgi:hypothetical protein
LSLNLKVFHLRDANRLRNLNDIMVPFEVPSQIKVLVLAHLLLIVIFPGGDAMPTHKLLVSSRVLTLLGSDVLVTHSLKILN